MRIILDKVHREEEEEEEEEEKTTNFKEVFALSHEHLKKTYENMPQWNKMFNTK